MLACLKKNISLEKKHASIFSLFSSWRGEEGESPLSGLPSLDPLRKDSESSFVSFSSWMTASDDGDDTENDSCVEGEKDAEDDDSCSVASEEQEVVKRVCFSMVDVIELQMISGDYLTCKNGPGVCCSSQVIRQRLYSVKEHQRHKAGVTKSRQELHMSVDTRRRIVRNDVVGEERWRKLEGKDQSWNEQEDDDNHTIPATRIWEASPHLPSRRYSPRSRLPIRRRSTPYNEDEGSDILDDSAHARSLSSLLSTIRPPMCHSDSMDEPPKQVFRREHLSRANDAGQSWEELVEQIDQGKQRALSIVKNIALLETRAKLVRQQKLLSGQSSDSLLTAL